MEGPRTRDYMGRKSKRGVAYVGECVWALNPGSKGKTGMSSRWSDGIWIGMKEDTGEHLIGTKEGVIKARTIRRKGSREERWNRARLAEIRGLPWNPMKRDLEEERKEVMMDMPGQEEPVQEEPLVENRKEPGAIERRSFQIKVSDIRRSGATPGCAGCKCTPQGKVEGDLTLRSAGGDSTMHSGRQET